MGVHQQLGSYFIKQIDDAHTVVTHGLNLGTLGMVASFTPLDRRVLIAVVGVSTPEDLEKTPDSVTMRNKTV